MLRSTSVVITTTRRVTVDGVVAGEQPDLAGAVARPQVPELLVRQRLQRGGVERPAAGAPGDLDAVLGDDGLAAARRRGDDDVVAGVERVERLELEVVEGERVAGTISARCSARTGPVSQGGRLRPRLLPGGACGVA